MFVWSLTLWWSSVKAQLIDRGVVYTSGHVLGTVTMGPAAGLSLQLELMHSELTTLAPPFSASLLLALEDLSPDQPSGFGNEAEYVSFEWRSINLCLL